MPAPSLSLIITTYNWPAALTLVLESVRTQRVLPLEVLVADDGSTGETRTLIKTLQSNFPIPLKHIWHPDKGFRAACIRNKAILQARGDVLVCVDGDCVLPAHFIARHRRLAEKGWFVAGSRILLSQTYTARVLAQTCMLPEHSIAILQMARQRHVNRWLPTLALPLGPVRKCTPYRWKGAKTCNLAAWKADILAVNGFDESFEGWGYEDSDLVIRLLRLGIKHKSGRFASFVFHLDHPEQSRDRAKENWARFMHIKAEGRLRAVYGLEEHAQTEHMGAS